MSRSGMIAAFLFGACLVVMGAGMNEVVAQVHDPCDPKGQVGPLDLLSYINPLIGTAKSDVFTRWGNEGGTYPGAVAPWGYMQLTPETRMGGGYDHGDPSIYFFSCFHHMSGYPNGSAGFMQVMPVGEAAAGNVGDSGSRSNAGYTTRYHRAFLKEDEKAEPGYYRVLFRDNNTLVETTVTERTGLFRFRFPPGVLPRIFIKTDGKISRRSRRSFRELQGSGLPVIFRFSENSSREEIVEGGLLLSFTPSSLHECVILLRTSVSLVGLESARKNIDVESGNLDFDLLRRRVRDTWRKELSVVGIDEGRRDRIKDRLDDRYEEKKKIFYTALYHSMLVPWVISDVDGNYRGKDRLIHKTSGKKEYGGFSPWDTFRSLHPLLCLLFPDRQRDMVLSMLDIARQTGYLPTGPMTGSHALPVILDSYAKGIRGFDSLWAYTAMKKGLLHPPFPEADREIYGQIGFIPSSYPESVTRTVEYAYDDWALSEFSRLILHPDADGTLAKRQSYNYRNLFDPSTLFLLPRQGDQFSRRPGNAGYKEGDKWVYSYFVPQHPDDLVNLMGGGPEFTARLDSALANQDIVFDNETVFHLPYLFNYSGRPDKTQAWVHTIMSKRFSAGPGGLPGNDDLGSVSSWYVFSAMGLFPFCPGRPEYTIGSPVFHSLTLRPFGSKPFTIKTHEGSLAKSDTGNSNKANTGSFFVRSLLINNKPYHDRQIPHSLLMQGGELVFEMGKGVESESYSSDTGSGTGKPATKKKDRDFHLTHCSVSKGRVAPHELFWLRFSLANAGNPGTKILRLTANGKEIGHKNCLLGSGTMLVDSLACRLYPYGRTKLEMEGMKPIEVEVDSIGGSSIEISNLVIKPLLRAGEEQLISFSAQNTGGLARLFLLPVSLNDVMIRTDSLYLEPGEAKTISQALPVGRIGWHTIRVGDAVEAAVQKFKVYKDNPESLFLDISMKQSGLDRSDKDLPLSDRSGFANDGKIVADTAMTGTTMTDIALTDTLKKRLLFGAGRYVEIPSSPSLDHLGETLTMIISVCPIAENKGLVDLFSKGDHHVLQVTGNKSLSFFAGGWGRGDCTVNLPATWLNHWHQLAGVCSGDSLRVYIDGELRGSAAVDGHTNLSVPATWTLGRNEEFPGQRIFEGYLDDIKLFAAPLTEEEIKSLYKKIGGK